MRISTDRNKCMDNNNNNTRLLVYYEILFVNLQ